MALDMSKFKSTYPEGSSCPLRKPTDERQYFKGRTVSPIGMVDIFSEKKEVITEIRKPNKMASLGEMRRIWDHVNESLYNKLIEIKYLNA
jgi:hypothetical protein